MKKINIKKMWLPFALVIVVAFSGVIAIRSVKKNDSDMLKEEKSSIIASTTELTSATEKKENKTTAKATTEEQTEVETKETEATTKYVAPVTTKKQENTTKLVTTTKAPKPVDTTKPAKPATTKAPKDEYYPALTKADVEEIKQYTINYIKSKGQPVEPSLDWDWAGYSTFDSVPYDLSIAGDMFKIDGGTDPVEWVKGRMRDTIDFHIKDWERENGKGTIGGLYPLVRTDGEYWDFTIGYC